MARELMIHEMLKEAVSQGKRNIENSYELTKQLVNIYVEGKYRDLIFVACGSSYHGAYCAKAFVEAVLKRRVLLLTSEDFAHYDNVLKKTDLILVMSFSGASTNSIEALRKVRELGRKAIGITGYPESDFRYESDVLIEYGLNGEKEPYETKGVTLLSLYLMLFAMEVGLRKHILKKADYQQHQKDMYFALEASTLMSAKAEKFAQKHKEMLKEMKDINFVSSKSGYPIMLEAKLKFGELIKICTDASELEEFIHGPAIKCNPDSVIFYLDTSAETSERCYEIFTATKSITPYAFLLSKNNYKDENVIELPIAVSPYLYSLFVLSFFQELVYQTTVLRDCFAENPWYKDFSSQIEIKSNKYNTEYYEMLKETF